MELQRLVQSQTLTLYQLNRLRFLGFFCLVLLLLLLFSVLSFVVVVIVVVVF